MRKVLAIEGEYNRQGYSIFLVYKGGSSDRIYHGGNCCEDSSVTVALDDRSCNSLREIRSFCQSAVKREAARHNTRSGYIVRIDDDAEYERMIQELRKQ